MNETESKIIDITKPVQTREGIPVTQLVKFHSLDRNFVLYGVYKGVVTQWMENGRYCKEQLSVFDILNVPEKKIVPLEFGDILPGDLIKHGTHAIYQVEAVTNDNIYLANFGKLSFSGLINNIYTYSQDRGKTWKPCHKEIEA